MQRTFGSLALFVVVALTADQLAAQSTGRSSTSNSRNAASSPSMFSNSASRGGSSMGASSMGRGGAGGANALGNAMGQNGQMQFGNGQTTGSERYMRGNRQSGNFVGSDIAEVSNFFSTLTGGRGGTGGAGTIGPQANNRGNDFNSQNQSQTSSIIPHRLVVAIPVNRTAASDGVVLSVAANRVIMLRALGRLQSQGPLNVSLQGRTATLRGVVATDHDRVLAEQLTLLEPGIDRVQNELTVAEVLPPGLPATVTE